MTTACKVGRYVQDCALNIVVVFQMYTIHIGVYPVCMQCIGVQVYSIYPVCMQCIGVQVYSIFTNIWTSECMRCSLW